MRVDVVISYKPPGKWCRVYLCRSVNSDEKFRLLLELCEDSLAEVVSHLEARHSIVGLPLLDVVTLGIMLCSALDAVHRSARCLHLNVRPATVLLTRPKRHAEPARVAQEHTALHTVRLCGFSLATRLPTSLQSSLIAGGHSLQAEKVANSTPGYMPLEQFKGEAQLKSDVYSMGATLLFAATGDHPFGSLREPHIRSKLETGGLCQHLLIHMLCCIY